MQSRNDLYDYLGYHDYERKLDALFAQRKADGPQRRQTQDMGHR